MIVADTNVLSEPLRRDPDRNVLDWLDKHEAELAITTITVAELLFGAQRLPESRRRTALLTSIEIVIRDASQRLLTFDEAAARQSAALRVVPERSGRPISTEDLMIAGIASAHGAAVATRNVVHFEGFGVDVVNPWNS